MHICLSLALFLLTYACLGKKHRNPRIIMAPCNILLFFKAKTEFASFFDVQGSAFPSSCPVMCSLRLYGFGVIVSSQSKTKRWKPWMEMWEQPTNYLLHTFDYHAIAHSWHQTSC